MSRKRRHRFGKWYGVRYEGDRVEIRFCLLKTCFEKQTRGYEHSPTSCGECVDAYKRGYDLGFQAGSLKDET